MKKLIFILIVAIGVLLSCNKWDGGWDSMELSADVPMNNYNISVPAVGGVYHVTCTNYSSMWLTVCREDSVEYYPYLGNQSFLAITGVWSKAVITDNVVTVAIQPNGSGKNRKFDVGLTVGDMFSGVTFNQLP